ncbi:MAG: hypothetical protein J5912_09645 [Clostridia bacterium]|nr:hypothetical protein [Clostridia bacterium]
MATELLWFLVFLIPAVIALVCVILRAVGKCGCAYKMRLRSGWMAFIPFLSAWLSGRMAEFSDKECRRSAKKTPKWGILNLVVRVFGVLFGSVSLSALLVFICTLFFKQNRFARNLMTFIFAQTENEFLSGARTVVFLSLAVMIAGALLFAATKVLDYLMTYKIFYAFSPKKAGVCFVLSFFIPLVGAIIFMVFGFAKKYVPLREAAEGEVFEEPAIEPVEEPERSAEEPAAEPEETVENVPDEGENGSVI